MTANRSYEIRPYAPADRMDVLALFERVWGTDRDEDWLVETYERNPYLEGAPMIVADAGGTVVGARPFVPFPMRSESVDFTAVYLNNAMVHPDHRRCGLFTRMMERTIRTFEEREASLLFNFANEKSAPGYRELGFQSFGTGGRRWVCVQRPGRYVRDRLDRPAGGAVETVANTVARGYLAVKRRRVGPSARWQIERRAGIPAGELALLYETDPPESLHTRREERLYKWLEGDPHSDYETFLASDGSTPAAALVVREQPDTAPRIVDAVPPTSSTGQSAFPALLEAVLTEYRSAESISVTGPVVPERLLPPEFLSAFGFVSSERPLLSRFTESDDVAFLFELDGGTGIPKDVVDPENWHVRVD